MPENDQLEEIKNRIWLTSKTRMEAEKRYDMYDNMAHVILCVFSIILIGIAVFSKKLPENVPIDAYMIWFSVWVIVFSVVVYGFGFGKTAVLHRECYLRLQELHDKVVGLEETKSAYHNILSSYPNHTDKDFHRLILNRTFFQSQTITDPNKKQLNWSWSMVGKFAISQLLFWVSPIAILAVSVGSIFWLW